MRKLFLVVVVIVISAGICIAQDKKQSTRPSFGLVGGATGSTIGGDDDSYNGMLIGWQAGVLMFLDCGSPNHFVFGAEANVSAEGSKYEDVGVSGKVILTYLNIPLVAQLRDPLGFYAEAGVQPGFLLSAKDKYNGATYDFKDAVNTFDFGIPLGIGYVHHNKLGVNLRYVLGVANINNTDNAKDHNNVWALRVFYVF